MPRSRLFRLIRIRTTLIRTTLSRSPLAGAALTGAALAGATLTGAALAGTALARSGAACSSGLFLGRLNRGGHEGNECRLLAGQLHDQRVISSNAGRGGTNACLAGQVVDVTALLGCHHGDHDAARARTSSTSRAMQVGLVFSRWVDVDHDRDIIDVYASSSDVRCDEYPYLARSELLEIAGSRILRQVAVEVDGGDALLTQLPRKLLGAVLGASEQQATPGP